MNHIFIMCGPSGAGKTSLIKELLLHYPHSFELCVSHTTRMKRENELEGVDYIFISKDEMIERIQNNFFIEYVEFAGNWYGTSFQQLAAAIKSSKNCILDLTFEGVENFKKLNNIEFSNKSIYISVFPPNTEALRERLGKRYGNNTQLLSERLRAGQETMEKILNNKLCHYNRPLKIFGTTEICYRMKTAKLLFVK